MASRARRLGDVGANAPSAWEFGNDPAQTHVFFAVYGRTAADRDRMLTTLRAELAKVGPSVEPTHSLDAAALPAKCEHFGYADGIGQPSIEGSGLPDFRGDGTPEAGGVWAPLKAGEFVLGWPNETGFPAAMPQPEVLGRNGSFLVYRKLQQHVGAFRTFLREQAARLYGADADEGVERLAAKLVGRWRSGCPLVLSPAHDDPTLASDWGRNNDFRYAQDPHGHACPFGAHIRRMNPRDDLDQRGDTSVRAHRIVRRGLTYGPPLSGEVDDGQERGVAFMAINASIRYQFEFLQTEWNNNGEFAGLSTGDVDPFTGEPREGSRFRIPSADAPPKNLFDLPRFVTVRGGGYFFIPSISALRFIAGQAP
jgi:Dyp-type peroxidase family